MKDFENYKDLHDLKLIIVVQHPRQYALEVANQRSELPDSGLYLDILKEYVQLVLNLVAQCDSINLIKSGKYSILSQLQLVPTQTCPNFNLSQNLSVNLGGCVYLRIEDVISNPSKTFSISDLEPPKISQKADFEEIPAFEKDIDEILFENKAVKKFLQKHQYHLSEVGNGVFPGTI